MATPRSPIPVTVAIFEAYHCAGGRGAETICTIYIYIYIVFHYGNLIELLNSNPV